MDRMKRRYNKDGSLDLLFTKKEFDTKYIIGCVTKYQYGGFNTVKEEDESEVVVRVNGYVNNLKNVAIRRKLEG